MTSFSQFKQIGQSVATGNAVLEQRLDAMDSFWKNTVQRAEDFDIHIGKRKKEFEAMADSFEKEFEGHEFEKSLSIYSNMSFNKGAVIKDAWGKAFEMFMEFATEGNTSVVSEWTFKQEVKDLLFPKKTSYSNKGFNKGEEPDDSKPVFDARKIYSLFCEKYGDPMNGGLEKKLECVEKVIGILKENHRRMDFNDKKRLLTINTGYYIEHWNRKEHKELISFSDDTLKPFNNEQDALALLLAHINALTSGTSLADAKCRMSEICVESRKSVSQWADLNLRHVPRMKLSYTDFYAEFDAEAYEVVKKILY